ncbi:MAG: MerR family transcriptional regulator [Flavobacteriaceae bacterium]|nr:MerR family transcriptional regulator [Flavobacteriaceae bacterium]MDZ4147675.1 MerR family transcriptional regulator [Flavobacteriaceae bacterium]
MVKSVFSIKDLENLSGIKAHTLRIWEKRYDLLQPQRTDTNIRYYNLVSLQKLLNIKYLNQNGYKISKIAKLSNVELAEKIKEVSRNDFPHALALADFKMAMINFDANHFHETHKRLSENLDFSQIFMDVFIPFLNELGLLWQTDSVRPSHEHFITGLIKQIILSNIQEIHAQQKQTTHKGVFVLYLPENEIHDIGITYLYYELLKNNYKTIYLGQSLPLESLIDFDDIYDEITFVTYFTVKPNIEDLDNYLVRFDTQINPNQKHKLWLIGRQTNYIMGKLPVQIQKFDSIQSLVDKI